MIDTYRHTFQCFGMAARPNTAYVIFTTMKLNKEFTPEWLVIEQVPGGGCSNFDREI